MATNLSRDTLKFQGIIVGWALPTIPRSLQRSPINGGQCPPYELSRFKLVAHGIKAHVMFHPIPDG